MIAEMELQEIKTQWRNATMALGALVGIILLAFFDTVTTLVMTWWDKPEYNHCLLILPILVFLVHERRDVFHKIAPKPYFWGLVPILGGGLLWMLGDLADANVVRQFGLIIILQGAILTILGKRMCLALLFPIFYMIFLIPFGDFLVPALQDFTTGFVITTLNIMDIPVYVEGVFLSIPAGDFHVAEACAGLRFLVATVALGSLMANVVYKTAGRQIAVVILAFIVPIIANGFRASGIILIAHWTDMEYATGVDHLVFGWIFFAIVLLIFISIAITFTNRSVHDGYIDFKKKYWASNDRVGVKSFIMFFALGAVFVSIAPVVITQTQQRYQSFENYRVSPDPLVWGQDVADQSRWKPNYIGASQTFHLLKKLPESPTGSPEIDVFIGYYKYQSAGLEMIRFGNGVAQGDLWSREQNKTFTATIAGQSHQVNEVLLQSRRGKRLVIYWYWVDGAIMASSYEAKLFDAKAKLTGGRLDSAVIALSIPVDQDSFAQQKKLLVEFAENLPPLERIVVTSQ